VKAIAFDPGLRKAERLLAKGRYNAALAAIGEVRVPVRPAPGFAARVLACELAALAGLAASNAA
jgi:hypothetical protein